MVRSISAIFAAAVLTVTLGSQAAVGSSSQSASRTAKLVPNVIPNCAAVASVTLIGITAAIWAWQPVIPFIGASVLGRDYGGHWLVVRGFTTNSEGITWADAYDRDQNPYNSSAHPDGAITIPLATFSDALTKELDTDSIAVTG